MSPFGVRVGEIGFSDVGVEFLQVISSFAHLSKTHTFPNTA